METKVAILILNWNGLKNTLECLESVFCSASILFQVVICDNASQDNSVAGIIAWCEGRLNVLPPIERINLPLKFIPCQKPISYIVTSQYEVESSSAPSVKDVDVVIIRNSSNLGFAGGNNIGLKYILDQNCFSYVWMINNDTVVTSNALNELVQYMHTHKDVGIAGSKLLYYYKYNLIQACGGAVYNKWLGTVKNIENDTNFLTDKMSYVVGASMIVSCTFIRQVGLLSEEYFVYFEEIDWAKRAEGKFSLGYAPKSVVYHKEGAAVGTSANPITRSLMSDYYLVRNRLVFTKKYYPYALPTIYLGILIVLLRRLLRCQFSRIPIMVKGAISREDYFRNVKK